jgi:thymidylate kinase
VPVLIAVWGSSPGIGKSTLCAGLARWLAGAGLRADHFREEEILTRPQYAAVAQEFQATGTVEPVTLLAATRLYADSILAGGIDVAVADALMPFIPSLLAVGHHDQAIDAFMSSLDQILAPLRPVMIFLDGDAGPALSRAAAREDQGWLDWYVTKLARYQVNPPVHDAVSAARYLRRERAVTLRAARRHNWDLIVIDNATSLTPDQALHAAIRELTPRIAGHQSSPAITLHKHPARRHES